MYSKKFQRNKEDFTCEKCGHRVEGDGYTNHCPKCLWSKHVDVFPGDREADCGGLMRPVFVEREGEEYVMTHKCIVCDYSKRNKVQKDDDFDEVVRIAKEGAL